MNAEKAKDYSSQLHAYKYALENNKDNKPIYHQYQTWNFNI